MINNETIKLMDLCQNFKTIIELKNLYLLTIDLTKSSPFIGFNSNAIQYSTISTISKRLSPVSILPINEWVTLSFFASSLCESPIFFLCSINISLKVRWTSECIDFLNFKLLIETILWALHNAPVLGTVCLVPHFDN